MGEGGVTQEEQSRSRTPAQLGRLHRVVATLESVLDLYRLALLELVPALRLVRQTGLEPEGNANVPLPVAAAEVFARVAHSIERRVPERALPALTRGYHAEVMDALEMLSVAERIGEVVKPARTLVRALREVLEDGQRVVDLFARERPIRVRVLDAPTLARDLLEGLEELESAEASLKRRQQALARNRRPETHQMLEAQVAISFRRVEIALGHVLDMWALDRQLGDASVLNGGQTAVDFRVPPRLPTETIESVLSSVTEGLERFEAVLVTMEVKPSPVRGMLQATLREVAKKPSEVNLAWALPRLAPRTGEARVSAVRIYRSDNVRDIRERVIDTLLCQGQSRELAEKETLAASAELTDDALRLADIEPGRSTYTDLLSMPPIAAPLYRVVAVSPFGVEGEGPRAEPIYIPLKDWGVVGVSAHLREVTPEDTAFYEDGGAVDVRWRRSVADVQNRPDAAAFAQEAGLPMVAHYLVERLEQDHRVVIAELPAGEEHWVDRPSVEALSKGLRYRVRAVAVDGREAMGAEGCPSAVVRADVRSSLVLARAGVAWLSHPTAHERALRARFANPDTFEKAYLEFANRPEQERLRHLFRWWQRVPREQRVRWFENWVQLMSDSERREWLDAWDGSLDESNEAWVRAEIWLQEHSELRKEVRRWWSLMDREAHVSALDRWLGKSKSPIEDLGDSVPEAAQVLAWWESRDKIEKGVLEQWWVSRDASARTEQVLAWYKELPEYLRIRVRWPPWTVRSKKEQELLIQEGTLVLPSALWRQALAFSAWESLEVEAKAVAIREEVGPLTAAWSTLKFALRPLDQRLGFHLLSVSIGLNILALFSVLLWRRRRSQKRPVMVVPPSSMNEVAKDC